MLHIGNLALGFTLTLLTLHLSPAVKTSHDGQPKVIGVSQPIIAAPGDDVILPCHLEPSFNVQGWTVEWSKPDLKPDPADRLHRVQYVHLYRNRRNDTDMMIPEYIMRTTLFVDGLIDGNISLKIMNVTLADTGRYRCHLPKLKSSVKDSVVELIVDPNFAKRSTEMPLNPENLPTSDPRDETTVGGARSCLGLILAVIAFVNLIVIGCFLQSKCLKQTELKANSDACQ